MITPIPRLISLSDNKLIALIAIVSIPMATANLVNIVPALSANSPLPSIILNMYIRPAIKAVIPVTVNPALISSPVSIVLINLRATLINKRLVAILRNIFPAWSISVMFPPFEIFPNATITPPRRTIIAVISPKAFRDCFSSIPDNIFITAAIIIKAALNEIITIDNLPKSLMSPILEVANANPAKIPDSIANEPSAPPNFFWSTNVNATNAPAIIPIAFAILSIALAFIANALASIKSDQLSKTS